MQNLFIGSQTGNAEAKDAYDKAMSTGTVQLPGGRLYQLPEWLQQQSAKAQAEGIGKAQGEVYQKFSDNGSKFEQTFQPQRNQLLELAHIYQNFQAGRGSEAIADLTGWANRVLPKGTQLPFVDGFDAAYKSAVQQAFSTLQDSGMQRAPRTGFAEALLTSARPDAAPAAIRKIMTDGLAYLDFNHDLYNKVGPRKDVNDALREFNSSHNFDDYVQKARKEVPMFKGITPDSLKMTTGENLYPDRPKGLPARTGWSASEGKWVAPDGTRYNPDGGKP